MLLTAGVVEHRWQYQLRPHFDVFPWTYVAATEPDNGSSNVDDREHKFCDNHESTESTESSLANETPKTLEDSRPKEIPTNLGGSRPNATRSDDKCDQADPTPVPRMYQGILAIDDCPEEVGGFCCVPGSARFLKQWCAAHAAPRPRRHDGRLPGNHYPDPESAIAKDMQRFPLRKGCVVIFDSGTCHANFKNTSQRSRHVQFVRMCPAETACKQRDKYASCHMKSAIPRSVRAELSDFEKKLCSLVPYEGAFPVRQRHGSRTSKREGIADVVIDLRSAAFLHLGTESDDK